MRLGLVSDSHDNIALCETVASFFRDSQVDQVFHLGDVTGEDALVPFEGLPLITLRGNNDDELPTLPTTWQQEFAGVKVAATHGHLRAEMARLSSEADILLHGHTHARRAETVGGCLVVNPGALYRTWTKTCALLDVRTRTPTFYAVDEKGVRRL